MYDLVKRVLFEQATYCPICGHVLQLYTDEVKICPCGCGQATAEENDIGLLIIAFEVP
jgi:RNA polymerase subunit RPABC4/transcription elongation factor Spt4